MLSAFFAGILENPWIMAIIAAVIGIVLYLLTHFGILKNEYPA